MAELREGGNEPPGSLKAINARNCRSYISVAGVPEFCPAGILLHASKSADMSMLYLFTKLQRNRERTRQSVTNLRAINLRNKQVRCITMTSRTDAMNCNGFPDGFTSFLRNYDAIDSFTNVPIT
ncbi:hypothetical protein ANN_07988 [Periplaneta americana]|uniref:Uncharacterized protein n=1 Tax=Periplaneta americana TaxID=6978 RepID=A0ABQ8T2E6_PERAM|nr:hypothetical protein ANN_07988 [Periplaneta americana]